MNKPSLPWWGTALLSSAAAVGLAALAMRLPNDEALSLLVVGILVFLYVLWRNPAFRYWKAFGVLAAMWFACRKAPNLFASVAWHEGQFGFVMTNDVSPVFDVFVGIILLALLVADALKDGRHLFSRLQSIFHREEQVQKSAGGAQQQTRFGDIRGGQNVFNFTQAASEVSSAGGASGHAELDLARGHIEAGEPDVALAFLERLRIRSSSTMSAHERYRLAALTGRAHEIKEDYADAARCYIEAKGHEPTERDAQQLEAAAYALIGENDKALDLAEKLFLKHPESAIALALIIRLSPESRSIEELDALVPASHREDAEVLAALGHRCKKYENVTKREDYFRRAWARLPDSERLMEEVASSIVAAETLVQQESGVPVTAEARARLDEACDLINKVFAKGDFSKNARARRRLVRGIAHDLSGRYEQAETDYRAARETGPDDQETAHYYFQFLIRRDRIDDAIDTLRSVASLSHGLQNAINLARLLGDRKQPGDGREAIAILEAACAQLKPDMGTDFLSDALSVLTHLYGDEQLHETALEVLERPICNGFPRSIIEAMRADVFRRASRKSEALASGRNAFAHLAADAPHGDQKRVAKSLTRAGLHEEAVAVWKRIVQPTVMTNSIRLALESAYKSQDDGFLIDLCAKLRANGILEDMAIELEVVTLVKYHAYREALVAIDAFLATKPIDKFARIMRLNRSQVGTALERNELIERNPALLPSVAESEPRIGCIVAQLLRFGPNPMDGVVYAYELLRSNFSNADAHKAFVGVVGFGESELPECTTVGDVVTVGCAVQYRDNSSGESKWVVIEDNPAADLMLGELSSSNVVANEMIGKHVGEEFHLRRDPIQDRLGTITAIANKYQYRKHDVIDRWEDRFPEVFFVKKYSHPKEEGIEPTVELIFKSIDLRVEFARQIHELYKSHPISVTHFARLSDVTVPEAMQHLASERELPIRCYSGAEDEWDAARKKLSVDSTVVLDLAALATIFLLGLHKQMQSFPFRVIVLQSARDVFSGLLRHENIMPTSEGSITKHEGQYVHIKESPEEKAQNVSSNGCLPCQAA